MTEREPKRPVRPVLTARERARVLKGNAAEVALAKAWGDGPWLGCMPPETYSTFTDPDEANASSD